MKTDTTTEAERIEAIKLLNELASFVEYIAMEIRYEPKRARDIAVAAGKLSQRFYQ